MRMILADHGATRGPTPEASLVDIKILDVDLPEIQGSCLSLELIAEWLAL